MSKPGVLPAKPVQSITYRPSKRAAAAMLAALKIYRYGK